MTPICIKRLSFSTLVCCTLWPLAAIARTEAGFLIGQDKLSAGRNEWRHESIFVEHKGDRGDIAGLRISTTQRFGLNDSQLEAGINVGLINKLRLGIEGNLSPTHQALARFGIGGNVQYEFARGWLLHGGGRQTRFDAVTVNQGSMGFEHYFGNWGAAFTALSSNAYTETNSAYVGRLSHYYGERNRINLMLASGREPASIAGAVINSSLWSATLTGRHWIAPRLALEYVIGTARQGDFYSRTGGSLGITVAY